MTPLKCGDCGTEFVVGRDVEVDGVECPMANCRSDDLIEFIEADDEDDDEDDD